MVARVSRAYTPPLHCIRCHAIVNVSRAEAAITSRRKEGRSRPNSAGRNSRATHSAVRFSRRDGSCVLGVGIYFAAPPVGGAIKAWQSRRLAREAFALIDQRKWSEANAKARDAYLLRPTEPESWRAIARLASRTGQWAAALEWWKKVDDAHRLTARGPARFCRLPRSVRVTYAGRKAGGSAAGTTRWAGADRYRVGRSSRCSPERSVLALDYAERVLADKRAKPYEILSAATLVLSVTSPYSQPYASAWKQIEDVARDPKNPGVA